MSSVVRRPFDFHVSYPSMFIPVTCSCFHMFLCLLVETRSNVPAYGCFLSSTRNPMQRQIPVIPKAQCWICSVNIKLLISSQSFQLFMMAENTNSGCWSKPMIFFCVLLVPEEVLWHSARSLPKRCSCNRCPAPERRKRKTMKMITIRPTTPTAFTTTIIIYTHW